MKMNLIFVFSTLAVLCGAGSLAEAGQVFCTDGDIFYKHSFKEGGAPPMPGMIVGQETLFVSGVLVATNIEKSDVAGSTEFTVTFVEKTKEVLKRTEAHLSGTEIFNQYVSFKKVAGKFQKGFEEYGGMMLCKSDWNHAIP